MSWIGVILFSHAMFLKFSRKWLFKRLQISNLNKNFKYSLRLRVPYMNKTNNLINKLTNVFFFLDNEYLQLYFPSYLFKIISLPFYNIHLAGMSM